MAKADEGASDEARSLDWKRIRDLRVLVCGGRSYADYARLRRVLDALWHETECGIGWLIHGGAHGADALAAHWALRNAIPTERYPADWFKHGKAAGPIRNRRMLDKATPHLVVAFPGGPGTADMVRQAKGRGIPVIEVGNTSEQPAAGPSSTSNHSQEGRE